MRFHMIIKKQTRLRGEIDIPGDKSISHRAIMIGSLAAGTTRIRHFLTGADCLSTISCFRKMGIQIEQRSDEILVHGKGLHGLMPPKAILDAGNSGTTTRLMSGILAGQRFDSQIDGDASLRARPMKRIMEPLTQMGAEIKSVSGEAKLPLLLSGRTFPLHAITYHSPIASAQVKSCILFAGMYADGETSVAEPVVSRNHTEVMLNSFGAKVTTQNRTAAIAPEPVLTARDIMVPGDISSAAYFLAAGLITPESEILLKAVGMNPTRDGMLRVLREMGADITVLNRNDEAEPYADLLVRTSSLKGTVIEGDIIPSLIDELPMLAVLAAFAEGKTIIRDAKELRVKESDRIISVTNGLAAMGADVVPTEDGMIIQGGKPLHGGIIDSCLDHRIAMSFAVAGTVCEGDQKIKGADCVKISYPDFYDHLYKLSES